MSVAPHSGIIDFGTFTSPTPSKDGIQGEVPAPLAEELGYLLSTEGWVPGTTGSGDVTGPGSATANNFASFDGTTGKIIKDSGVSAASFVTTNGTGATGTWNISISGNAATVSNGLYANGSYSNPTWIVSLDGSKITGQVSSASNADTVTNGLYSTGSYADPVWLTSLAGSKITGSVASAGTAATVTNGVYTTDVGTVTNTMLAGSIANNKLSNSSVTIGTTNISLGGTASTLGGLTSVAVTQNPTTDLQLATKQYVDSVAVQSIHYHEAVKYEVPSSTGNLNATYNNGSSGVGATLTNAGTQTAFTPDGVVASVGDRILVYNQTNGYENGIYVVTTVGSGSTNWVLTRASDANTYDPISPNGLGGGDAFFVQAGNTGAGETYVCDNAGSITFGVTPITFAQISSAQIYSAGTGLTLTNTTFSITNTGVSAATYGSASSVPVIAVNAQGQITSASNSTININTNQIVTGVLDIDHGGTGQSSYVDGQLLIGNSTGNTLSKSTLTQGSGINITNGSGTITIANAAPDQTVVLTSGTGISTTGTYPNFTITNTSPDQVVSLTGAGTTSISGTYPSFTITSNDQYVGTVTSVAASGGTGISVTGSPITSSGTLTITNTAPDQVVSLANGTGISVTGTYPSFTVTNTAPDQIVSLTGSGGTTVTGTYPNFTISSTSGGTGTVTSVSGTGTVSGISLSGTVTTSGSLTLGGSLDISNYTGSVGGTGFSTYLASPPEIGGTAPAAITGTRFTATGSTLPTNGMYLPTTNSLGFSTNSVENCRIDANGDMWNITNATLTSAWYRFGDGTTTYAAINGVYSSASAGYMTLSTREASVLTEQVRITTNGGISFGPAGNAFGTTGQKLISAGDATPIWTSSSSASAFTTGTNATYTVPAGCTRVKVTIQGPGGNGGAANNQRATGGSAGGTCIKWLAVTPGDTMTYTVGTASGTASTVVYSAVTYTANSGSNGTGTAYALSVTAGPTGGTATNGDINITGGRGGNSFGSSTTVTTNFSGFGANSPFGNGGGALAMVATAGQAATGYGAGGGGAHGNNTAGNGTGGIIIFEPY